MNQLDLPALENILRDNLGIAATDLLTPEATLEDVGLDSLDLVELVSVLEDRWGIAIDIPDGAVTMPCQDLLAVLTPAAS